jgi:hypothetical protein
VNSGDLRSSPAAITLNPALRPHRLRDKQERGIKRCIRFDEFEQDEALLAAEREGDGIHRPISWRPKLPCKFARQGRALGIAFSRQTVHDAEMKTLWLRTVNEDPVYTDSNGKATLDSTSGPCIEAGEGEHSDAKIEAIRKAASELLGVNCVWVEEGEGTDEILGQPGKPPPI